MTHGKRQITSKVLARVGALALILGAAPAFAQLQPSPQSAPTEGPVAPSVSSLEGTVKKVDPATGKVEIAAGLFGFFGRTLEVTPDTVIVVAGRDSNLSDVREGNKVKASFEVREGQSVAKSIEVRPEHRRRTAPSSAQ